jgi:hypothetical protein
MLRVVVMLNVCYTIMLTYLMFVYGYSCGLHLLVPPTRVGHMAWSACFGTSRELSRHFLVLEQIAEPSPAGQVITGLGCPGGTIFQAKNSVSPTTRAPLAMGMPVVRHL